MSRVLIVYATRHGGTAGIALRIAETLRSNRLDVVVADAAEQPDPSGFDAYVVGSGVQIGSWYKEALEYLEQHRPILGIRAVWLFSSGPLPGSSVTAEAVTDPITLALGPEEGPGSGGRKKLEAIAAVLRPRDHRVFTGAYDPKAPSKSIPERFVRLMPGSKKILPAGDFRDWDSVVGWANEIAAELAGRVAAPAG